MPKLTVVTRDGVEHELTANPGVSVMEAIRDAGFDELLALCGGCLSCATCHVYFDAPDGAQAAAPTSDEDELLDTSEQRRSNSRLSCQLMITPAFDGARIEIAAAD